MKTLAVTYFQAKNVFFFRKKMLSARLLNFSFCYMYRLRENSDICLQRYSCAAFLQENGRPNAGRNMNK